MTLAVLLLGVLAVAGRGEAAGCRTYAATILGEGAKPELFASEPVSMKDVRSLFPRYDIPKYRGPGAPPAISWVPHAKAPDVDLRKVGTVGGRLVYSAWYSGNPDYNPAAFLLLSDAGNGTYCPAFYFSGAKSIVAAVDEPVLFAASGAELVAVKVHILGTGNFEESYFFTAGDNALQHLQQDDITQPLEANHLEVSSRGGGFCRGTLRWQNVGWDAYDDARAGWVRIEHEVVGGQLRIRSLGVVPRTEPEDCE